MGFGRQVDAPVRFPGLVLRESDEVQVTAVE